MEKTSWLISKDSRNKIRVIQIDVDESNPNEYKIIRTSGLLNGKQIFHPVITITKGKAGRSTQEQFELEYSHLISKQLDKGYIQFETNPKFVSEDVLLAKFGETKTDTNGFRKHMLAKSITTVNKNKVFTPDKTWYISRKIDGVRCSMYFNNNKIITASRGGKTYDDATKHLRDNPELIKFFEKNPNVIFDGELYVYGKTLQQISGCARCQEKQPPFLLQYYIYDIQEDNPFNIRLTHLKSLLKQLNIDENSFNPFKAFAPDDVFIQFVPQKSITGNDAITQIWKLHDEYVKDGWEGCVARNGDSTYKYGCRTDDMIKFKNYQDAEFKVIDIEGGNLRVIDDMVFILETQEGKQFKAKPIGDYLQKKLYWDNFKDFYKNKFGTCKYFYLSEDKIPLQPVFVAFRDSE